MLANSSKAIIYRSNGEQDEQPHAYVLLADCHAEYTSQWPKTYGRWPEGYAYVRDINVSQIEEAREVLTGNPSWQGGDEDEWNKVWEFLLPGFAATLEMTPLNNYSHIWMIEGDIRGHQAAFAELLGWLDVQPSGDDDFFDYWPNTMDMLWHYASDLDQWANEVSGTTEADLESRVYRDRVHALFRKVWEGAQQDIRDEWLGHPWAILEAVDEAG